MLSILAYNFKFFIAPLHMGIGYEGFYGPNSGLTQGNPGKGGSQW